MAYGTAIYNILRANSTIVSKFGTRIYADEIPGGGSLPCITYAVDNVTAEETKDYYTFWDNVEISVSVYARTAAEADSLAEYVRTAMNRYSGTQDGEVIDTVVYRGRTATYDELMNMGGTQTVTGVYIRTLTFTMIIK